MRFFDEWKHPEKKCERLGHKEGTRYRTGYVYPRSSWYVTEKVTQECKACKRCRLGLSEFKDVGERQGFTGYSWPSDQAEAYRRDGHYWTSEGWA